MSKHDDSQKCDEAENEAHVTAVKLVIDRLMDCVEGLKDEVDMAVFAQGMTVFATSIVFDYAPSPMHAARMFLQSVNARIHDEVERLDAESWSPKVGDRVVYTGGDFPEIVDRVGKVSALQVGDTVSVCYEGSPTEYYLVPKDCLNLVGEFEGGVGMKKVVVITHDGETDFRIMARDEFPLDSLIGGTK